MRVFRIKRFSIVLLRWECKAGYIEEIRCSILVVSKEVKWRVFLSRTTTLLRYWMLVDGTMS